MPWLYRWTKQPRRVVRAVRLWSPEAQDSLSPKKKFSLIFATAASNTMQCVLGCFRELCERPREMTISAVAGAWGRDCVFSPFPALLSSWVGWGGRLPQNHLVLVIRPPRVPGPVRGEQQQGPPRRRLHTPQRAPSEEKTSKHIHLDCTLLLFRAYSVLSVVDNSLLSYIKKYLNDVQYAMP